MFDYVLTIAFIPKIIMLWDGFLISTETLFFEPSPNQRRVLNAMRAKLGMGPTGPSPAYQLHRQRNLHHTTHGIRLAK